MNQAGQSRVSQAITNMTLCETGSIEFASPPTASLGDVMSAGGPNVTNIDIQCGAQGVTTTYRFQTYTNRFGVFGKGYDQRLRRMGAAGIELRRNLRASVREGQIAQGAVAALAGEIVLNKFMENARNVILKRSPHDMLVAHAVPDVDFNGNAVVRTNTQTATFDEALSLLNPPDGKQAATTDDYLNTAAMSLNGLVRPFSTDPAYTGWLSHYKSVGTTGTPALDQANLDPWKDAKNDIEAWLWGSDYQGVITFNTDQSPANTKARPIALRGPLVLTGWGFDTDGKCVPAASGDRDQWLPQCLRRQDAWKTGPVDLLWDDRRGVWTCHDIVRGVTNAAIPAGGSGVISLASGPGTVTAWNFSANVGVSGDTNVLAGYVAGDNKWYIMSADCQG